MFVYCIKYQLNVMQVNFSCEAVSFYLAMTEYHTCQLWSHEGEEAAISTCKTHKIQNILHIPDGN